MMQDLRKVYVELVNDSNECMLLDFNVYDTPIANKWYNELKRIVALSDDHIKERDRFYNFPGDKWDEPAIIAKINECIDIINAYQPTIDMMAVVDGGQEHFNNLHKHFELMRGQVDKQTDFFKSAPPNIKTAIEVYNVAIHRLESHLRSKSKTKPLPRLVIRMQNQKRIPMIDEDFDHFTLVTQFGEVYLNYCEVGKHLLEMCGDNDSIIGEEAIRPQRHYSASFLVKFFNSDGIALTEKFNTWWGENESYLNSVGFIKSDKTLAIGYLPVAILQTCYSERELIKEIGKFNRVDRIFFNIFDDCTNK
jgi:hypothetical protein